MTYWPKPTKDYSDERAAVTQHVQQLADYPEWRESIKLVKQLLPHVTGHQPNTPAASWGDQIFRSASSVPANIAEGVGRMMTSQVIQFLRIARGSAFETISHLMTCPLPDFDTHLLRAEYAKLIELVDATLAKLID